MTYLYSTFCTLALISMFTVGGKAKVESTLETSEGYSKSTKEVVQLGAKINSAGVAHASSALNITLNDSQSPDIQLSNGQSYRVHPFQQQIIKEWKPGELVALSESDDSHPIKLIHIPSGKEIRAKSIN